jgi:tRNA pseudouridine38-40 synthase
VRLYQCWNLLNNYKLKIEYNGAKYYGSQYQPNKLTIEGVLKEAIVKILKNKDIKTIFSGRTDAGVHAKGQVLTFKTENNIPDKKLKIAINNLLPKNIYVKEVEKVDIGFNPRKFATSREYRYLFANEELPVYMKQFVEKVNFEPNIDAINRIKKKIIGKHAFSF